MTRELKLTDIEKIIGSTEGLAITDIKKIIGSTEGLDINKNADNKVYEKTSVAFAATDPDTKTLQKSPASGKAWYVSKIKAWTNEKPSDNANAGSKTDIDLYINGTTKKIAKSYASEQIGTTFRTCGISLDCEKVFGQRLKITETTNGVYVSATKTGASTPTLYLEVEGTEK